MHTFNDNKFPSLSKEHVDLCSYSSWYPKLEKNHSTFLVKSRILEKVPENFIKFLLEDGIKLKQDSLMQVSNANDDFSDWSEEDNDNDDVSCDENDAATSFIDPSKEFSEVHEFISDCFSEYSKLTPRLNWSAPKDSVWILPYNNTMMTCTPDDVYLLLKSSNYIMHDLQYAYENIDGGNNEAPKHHSLVLRKWIENMNPSLEFRCFIKNGSIIGISQRDIRTEYCYLNDIKEELRSKIEDFVNNVFKHVFFDADKLDPVPASAQNAVIDLYVDIDKNVLKLIDVNPFCRSTDPLLFSWNELVTKQNSQEYEFRLGENNTKLGGRDHSENQVPLEIFDASLDPEKLRELTYEWNRLLDTQLKEEK